MYLEIYFKQNILNPSLTPLSSLPLQTPNLVRGKSSSLPCFSTEASSLEAFILITKSLQISNLVLGV